MHEGPPQIKGRLKSSNPAAYRKWWARFRIAFVFMITGLVLVSVGALVITSEQLEIPIIVSGLAVFAFGFSAYSILILER